MRCESPWSASVGAQNAISPIASANSAAVAPARTGSQFPAGGALTAAMVVTQRLSLGYDVLERRPREQREDRVVEHEEAEVAAAGTGARADAADDDGDRERQEEERQDQLSRPPGDGHRAGQRSDRADADVRERDRGDGAAVDAREEGGERRQGHELGEHEKRADGDALRDPDRAPVARGEDQRVHRPLLPLGHERAREAEERGEDERDPEEAERGDVTRAAREREVEDRQRREDEQQHR